MFIWHCVLYLLEIFPGQMVSLIPSDLNTLHIVLGNSEGIINSNLILIQYKFMELSKILIYPVYAFLKAVAPYPPW